MINTMTVSYWTVRIYIYICTYIYIYIDIHNAYNRSGAYRRIWDCHVNNR